MNKAQNWQSLILQLKQIAEDKGISQGDIARETGYYRQNINRFFQGRVCPSMEMFLNVCQAVGVDIKL